MSEGEVPVCMDETGRRQTLGTATPIPAEPGRPEIQDFEHCRNGMPGVFMFHAPPKGRRRGAVADRCTRKDRAGQIRKPVDEDFPGRHVTFLPGNPDAHSLGSLCETFRPEEAGRVASRLAPAFTLPRGSWLNMAETGRGALSRQRLDRKIPGRGP